MMKFLHRILLLTALVCLVTCLPQAPAKCPLDVLKKQNLNGIPKVGTEEVKRELPRIKGILNTLGIGTPTLPKAGSDPQGLDRKKPSLPSLGISGAPSIPDLRLVDLSRQINKLEAGNCENRQFLCNLQGARDVAYTRLCSPNVTALIGTALSNALLYPEALGIYLAADADKSAKERKVLKFLGYIKVVGDKMIASSGKDEEIEKSHSTCKAIGGRIATPVNEAENNATLFFLKKYNQYAYIGLTEGPIPGIFHYHNGIPALYTHWRKNEPSGKGQEKCVEMYTDGQWNDKGCNQRRLTVCEL